LAFKISVQQSAESAVLWVKKGGRAIFLTDCKFPTEKITGAHNINFALNFTEWERASAQL